MSNGRSYWFETEKSAPLLQVIRDHVDGRRYYMLTPMDWEYLARIGHHSMTVEEVQLMAVVADPRVLKHLYNASDRVQRLHTLKWKL